MFRSIRPFLLLPLTLLSCTQSHPDKDQPNHNTAANQMSSEKSLLDHVKLAINPKFQDWVLFGNGTYIVFDNTDTIADVKAEALKLMKEFGPVHAGGPAGDFSVIHLKQTEGWVVSGHCYGMYTYVNPSELDTKTPDDVTIGIYARSKRDSDGKNPVIVHINRKK